MVNKHRYNEAVLSRLSRIEGQIRGIKSMVQDGRECEDIFMQISAVGSAITNVSLLIVEDHIEHCVRSVIESGDVQETLDNLVDVFRQFSKLK